MKYKYATIGIFILIITVIIMLIGLSYRYGQVDVIIDMVGFEPLCDELNVTDYSIVYSNNTCFLGNGTHSYKIGNFIIQSNETLRFSDRLSMLLYTGKYIKEVKNES
jgi:hypothetical protein